MTDRPPPDPLDAFARAYGRDRDSGLPQPLRAYLASVPGLRALLAEALFDAEFDDDSAAADPTTSAGDDPATEPDTEDPRIGPYRLVRELGRGGQAVVFLARDTRLPRDVALKVLHGSALFASRDAAARFAREAEVTARLDHPGIGAVFETGDDDGVAWIAMRYVDGGTLAAEIESGLTTDRALELVEGVARALHAAHDAGVVHRDVKPGNVLIARDGTPVVVDFGLAHDDSADATLTNTGAQFGTPAYMAPEQIRAAGGASTAGRATDIWALGVTLFECLTGRRPFEAATRDALYRAILSGSVPPLPRGGSSLPRELDTVIRTALAPEPDRRYRTAAAFADDVARVRRREPILATRPSVALRCQRWVQRNPVVTGVLAALVVALGVLSWTFSALRSSLDGFDRLADRLELTALLREDDADARPAWPRHEASLAAWCARGDALVARLDGHRETRTSIATRATRAADGTLEFATRRDAALHDALTSMIHELEQFAAPEAQLALGHERLAWARRVRAESVDAYDRAWRDAIARVSARIPALTDTLAPQLGLVPLGPDPNSDLEEFAHVASGTPPTRREDGTLDLRDDSSIVFVLVPGGTFTMGAQSTNADAERFDRDLRPNETHLDTVTLAPFFLAKCELTHHQWRALTHRDAPSVYAVDSRTFGTTITARHPVQNVSWRRATRALARHGLELPTEAQWEFAARAGTPMRYPGTDDATGLAASANVLDKTAFDAGFRGSGHEAWSDGYVVTAPVATFAPNAFGFHDLAGNVWEWCTDRFGLWTEYTPRPGDGRLDVPTSADEKFIGRGGSYGFNAVHARCAARAWQSADATDDYWGVRAARRILGADEQ